jgi:site-specific recombinase XerD
MASLKKRGQKWYVRIRSNGLDKLIPTFTSIRRDAEIILRKYQLNETEVKLHLAESLLESSITVENCILFFNTNYQTEKGITDSTEKSYKNALQDFEDCFTPKRSISSLQRRENSLLVTYLKSRYNETTVNIRLRGIRLFLNYLLEKDIIKTLPFTLKQIKTDKAPPKMITPEEMDLIYSQIENPVLLSSYKVLEVTGMRLGELKNSRRDGEFIIVDKSKARKKRFIPFPIEYIQDYETATESVYSDSWLSRSFTNARENAREKDGLDEKTKESLKGKTAHSLRHTFAYRMLLETDNIQLVRDMLGHSSLSVTEIYTQIPTDYLKQVFTDKNINKNTTFKTVGNA